MPRLNQLLCGNIAQPVRAARNKYMFHLNHYKASRCLPHIIWAAVIAGPGLVAIWRCERFAAKRLELVQERKKAMQETQQAEAALKLREREAASSSQTASAPLS